ncbi:conserved hypothetical protein [Leishmania major strain Friedlin]|uniref:Protein NO VEIN C-terminal domain-containing protein n=1 Tax=Leishmania major TaxID=5664 RepID=Q4QIY0_LEIMA|nr:conserved hypothetical protein [Leishmania major strain Friedlin]CAG9568894.1 Domain_of_unknown_function_(DUF3883)_-_putative [Leishmania major strain Friedlin]CAJ02143.1 conserved hypothetical protein [Leishmania major strain Friedlin]|eukprot:XP_001680868.1 conserved hypothetical protein [Leishmania major strain Friedlin]
MQRADNGAQLQMLLRVNEYVQEQRQTYMTLSLGEQRRRGPLLLEDLLTMVMHNLLLEPENSEGDDDGGVQRPRARAGMASGARTMEVLASSTNSLPFALRDVPALANVAALQLRLTSTVMAAISTRAIVTVHELEEWVCAQEGVEHFAELGLGVGLQVLPVVQEYFQLRANSVVFPVRARDVIAFLLSDTTARDMLLYGGGDTRDLLYRFAAFYERHVLRNASPSSAPAAVRGQGRLLNVRQLGIHVQDYTALLAALTQELASAHQLEQQQYQRWIESCATAETEVTQTASTRDSAGVAVAKDSAAGEDALVRAASFEVAARRERNRALYERVLHSFDSACAHAELVEGMRRTHEKVLCASLGSDADAVPRVRPAGARAMQFAVTLTEAEARTYSLPLSLWRTAPLDDEACSLLAGGNGWGGGVELRFHVGALTEPEVSRAAQGPAQGSSASTTPRAAPLDSQWTASAAKGEKQAPGQRISNDNISGVLPPPSSAMRRRRGTVVSDIPSAISTGAPIAAAGAAATTETWRVTSPDAAPALVGAASTVPAVTAASAIPLLSSLLAPAGSLGLAVTSSVTTVDAPPSVSPRSADTAVERAPSVEGKPSAADVVGSSVETPTEPKTALEKLGDLLRQHRRWSAATKRRDAPASEQPTVLSTGDTWLDLAVSAFETFAVGDVVPVKLLYEAWAMCADCRGPAQPPPSPHSAEAHGATSGHFTHRRCIPLFHPFVTSVDRSSAGSLSPLALLRRQLGAGDTGGAPPAAASTPDAEDGATGERKEIVHMATPVEVCWLSWWGPAPPDGRPSREAAILTCACLERHYPSYLQDVFCGQLRVRARPTVAAWCTAAVACARRLCPLSALTPSFADAYVASFACCVDADVAAWVAEVHQEGTPTTAPTPGSDSVELPFLQRQQRTAQVALRRVLANLQESLAGASPWRVGLFPCNHAWCCGLDGLLYATPQWCGYGGVLLTASSPSLPAHTSVAAYLSQGGSANGAGAAPPLRVLSFRAHEPSWAVCSVLHYLGIRPLSQVAETRVSFHTTVATDASGVLHDKIAAIVPYVQAFCRASLPLWYGVVYVSMRERLRRLRVVLTASASPVQTLRLHMNGHVYAHERQLRLGYVAAHNVVYGAAEATSVPMLAEVLLPLFMPVGMSAEADVRQLRDVILRLLGALSSLDSSVEWRDGADTSPQQQQWRREQIEHVLRPVAMHYGLTPFTGVSSAALPPASGVSAGGVGSAHDSDAHDAQAEAPFTLSSRAFIRYMPNYPPGTDAMRQPRGSQQAHTGHRGGEASGTQSLTQASAQELVGHARPFSSRTASIARAGGGLMQRLGANGQLSVTLSLGGSTAVVTSTGAWSNFPMELDLDAVVAASVVVGAMDGSGRGGNATAAACDHQGDGDDDSSSTPGSDGDVGSSAAVGGGEEEEQDSFLTFQYHRRSGTASSALRGSGGGAESRKRLRAGNSHAAGHVRGRLRDDPAGRDVRAAGMWLRPPAASAMTGTGGDTPEYAVAAERYVYELLREEYAKQVYQDGVRVIWMNESCEAGSPFDILVIKPRRLSSISSGNAKVSCSSSVDNSRWDVVQYVEVKSTCTANREDFEMSMSELLFAARFGAAYCVYRVFGASTDALHRMRHRVYTDIVQLWHRARLTITSDIRVTPST